MVGSPIWSLQANRRIPAVLKLKVPDMTCGHCVATVEKAVRGVDALASVKTDLAQKIMTIETTAAAQSVSEAIRNAGYANEKIAA